MPPTMCCRFRCTSWPSEAFVPVVDGYRRRSTRHHFTYCNGGYIVLAIIAERASGRSITTSSKRRSAPEPGWRRPRS